MTTKVHQKVSPGFFFEQDVSLLNVAGTFTPAQWGNIAYDANGVLVAASDDVQAILNVIGTRGTVIAISTDTVQPTAAAPAGTNGNYMALIVGHAGGMFGDTAPNVIAELQAGIDAAVGTGYTLTLGTRFTVV